MKKIAILTTVLLIFALCFPSVAEKSLSAEASDSADSANSAAVDIQALSSDAAEDVYTGIENYTFDDIQVLSDRDVPLNWAFDAYYANEDAYMETVTDEQVGNCLHIVCGSNNDARAVQTVYVSPNTYYKLSCIIRTKNIEGGAGANISVMYFKEASSKGIYATSDWQEVELVIYTSNNSSFDLGLRIGGYSAESKGEAWFDKVKLEKLSNEPETFFEMPLANTNNNQPNAEENTNDKMPYAAMTVALVCTVLAALAVYFIFFRKKQPVGNGGWLLLLVLAAAFVVRLIANYAFTSISGYYGHSTDIRCFAAWGAKVWAEGPAKFYSEGYFADYPPGYMWILGLCEGLRLALKLDYCSAAHCFITKLPAILCDIATAYMAYRIAVKTGKTKRTGILMACFIAFNPVIIFLSSVWGQVDSILALFVVLTFVWLINGVQNDKVSDMSLAGLFYGIAVAVKPQALMVGPIFALVYIVYFIKSVKTKNVKKSILGTVLAAILAFSAIIIPSIPFTGTQEGAWLINKYAGTATSYNYATIEAYNLYALLGANWTNADTAFLGSITYKQVGTAFMVLAVAASMLLYCLSDKKQRGAVFVAAAYALAGIFTFGHFMHERYIFPVIILVFIAMLYYDDLRLFHVYAGFSVTMLMNTMCAFIITDLQSARTGAYDIYMKICAVLTIAVFVYFSYVAYKLLIKKEHNEKWKLFLKS